MTRRPSITPPPPPPGQRDISGLMIFSDRKDGTKDESFTWQHDSHLSLSFKGKQELFVFRKQDTAIL